MEDLRCIRAAGLALLLSFPLSTVRASAEEATVEDPPCPNGAIFKSDDGKEVIAIRAGAVYVPWTGTGVPLPGLAIELQLPSGQPGYIYGPMRSSFFITDETVRAKYGVEWSGPISATGSYRIFTDDGNDVIMTLVGDRCR